MFIRPMHKRSRRSSLRSARHVSVPFLEPLEDRMLLTTELIRNGTFEAGAVEFATDYRPYEGDYLPEGHYAVTTDPRLVHRDAATYGDHTSGDGLMMVVNAALAGNAIVWSQTVDVRPDSVYDFSLWVSSWFFASPARLEFVFDDVSVGTMTAPEVTGAWRQFTAIWNSETKTSVTVKIFERNATFYGNDFALDDISLLGEPGKQSDLVATSLEWNVKLGGLDFSYEVRDIDLPTRTTLALYWASGPTVYDIIGDYAVSATAQRAVGSYGPIYVPESLLGPPPREATHVLLIADPDGLIRESDEDNNLLALSLGRAPGGSPLMRGTPLLDPLAIIFCILGPQEKKATR